MTRWVRSVRFSFAGMMGIVVLIAFGCGALRSASDLWASAALTLAVAVLFAGILGVLFRRLDARAFWSGFALFGWGYAVLVFGPWLNTNIGPQLVTTKLLGYVHEKLQQTGQAPVSQIAAGRGVALLDYDSDGWADLYVANAWSAPDSSFTNVASSQNTLYRNLGNGRFVNITAVANGPVPGSPWENFQRVGHSLLALFFGLIGGMLARYFYAARGQGATPKEEQP